MRICSINRPERSPARPALAPATDRSWQGEPPQMICTGGSFAPSSLSLIHIFLSHAGGRLYLCFQPDPAVKHLGGEPKPLRQIPDPLNLTGKALYLRLRNFSKRLRILHFIVLPILQILMFQILRCDAMIPAKLDGAIENSSHSCMSIPSSIWLSSKGAVTSISPPRRLST